MLQTATPQRDQRVTVAFSTAPATGFRRGFGWLLRLAAGLLALLPLGSAVAQTPTMLGTSAANGTYTSYTLNAVGGFRQFRLQAANAGTGRTWEFYATSPSNYFHNWRPYTSGQVLAGFNQYIDPTTSAASARYNTNTGGASGVLPAITSGRYYTFNVANSTGNRGTAGNSGYGNSMAVLETTYNPVTVTAVTNPGQSHGQSSTITATTSATPNAAEYLWLRYTTDNFATSTLVLMTGSGTSWSGPIPAQPLGTTLRYYVLTSPLNAGVTHTTADMLTLNVNNNGGSNYTLAIGLCGTYTVDPAGSGANNFTSMGAAITALNTYGVGTGCTGGVTFSVKDGVVFNEQNLQIDAFTNAGNRTVTFQRDNSGATRPLVQPAASFSTGGTQDAIIKLNGADYVTFDGIDVAENPANTGANRMEYGYALFRPSVTNACQFVNIRNCAITLDKTNTNLTVGIYGALTDLAGAAIAVTNGTTTGISRDVKINGCTISNSYYGIWLNGGTGSQQADQGGEIGTTTGNTLSNLGGGTLNGSAAAVYGVRVEGFAGVRVENNTITLSVSGTAAAYGIGLGVGTPGATNTTSLLPSGGPAVVSTNNVRLTTTTSGAAYCIYQAAQNLTGGTFANNTFQNCSIVGATNGGFIRDDVNSGASAGTSMTGNTVGGSAGTANTVTLAAGTLYGLYASGPNVANGTLTESYSNNVMRYNTLGGGGVTVHGVGRTSVNQASVNVTVSNNQVSNNTFTSTGTVSAIITPGLSNRTLTVSNNTVQHNTGTGAGQNFYGINHFLLYAPATGLISNNLIDGNQLTGGGAARFYAISGGVGAAFDVTGNTITNNAITNAGAGATFYGCYYSYALPSGTNFQSYTNNVITDNSISATGTVTGLAMFGILTQGGNANQTSTVTGNTIGNLTIGSSGSTTVTGNVRGIQVENSTTMTVSRNKVYGLTAFGTAGQAIGILLNNIAGTATSTCSHNVVGGLSTPASTDANGVMGLHLAATSTTMTMRVYHNTVHLTGGGGSTFGSSGIYLNTPTTTTATTVYDLRNNLVQNLQTPGSTSGVVAALRNNVATGTVMAPTNIAATSDNNVYYAGTPGLRQVIYVEATTSSVNQYPWLAGYQQMGTTRELNSRTGPVTFASTTGSSASFLRLTAGVSQPAESAGQVIASETTDIDGDIRFGVTGYSGTGTAPDAGADEVAATPADLTGPVILYTPLGRQTATTGPTLSVTITDASGVNTTTGTRPRLYYKLSTNADQVNTNTNASVGWKWVEATNTSSPFTFTMDYSKLPTAPVNGNTIQYMVVAQDLAATPNVSANASVMFTTNPTSVALATVNFPVLTGNGGGTIRSFVIGAGFSGTINVGTGQTYTTLASPGGLFAALNAGVLTGNLTVLITSDIPSDAGSVLLNPLNESPAGSNFTISVQPSAAALRTITFPNGGSGYIFLNGADRVTFDGRFNQTGNDKFLRFRHAGGNINFWLQQDATFNTVRNCILEGGNNNPAYGTVYLGPSTLTLTNGVSGGVTGNSNFTLLNCDVRDNSAGASSPNQGFLSAGSTAPTNDNVTISGCNFFNFTTIGLSVSNGGNNWTIGGATAAEGNSFYNTNATTNAPVMINLNLTSTATNCVVRNNTLGGNAAGSTGTYTYTNNGVFTALSLTGGANAANNVQIRNNVIRNISQTNTGTGTYFRGISLTGTAGYVIADNTVTNITSAGSFQWYQTGFMYIPNGNTAGIYVSGSSANQSVAGNTVSNIGLTFSGATPTTFAGIAVNGGTVNVSRNRVFGLTNVNATASSAAIGLYFFNCTATATNNQISITNGTNTNDAQLYGIVDWTLVSGTFYYNSVYIGGSQAAGTSYHSYCYRRANQNAVTLRNNVFLNERTSTGTATAKHFAAGVVGGNGLLTSNYNDFWAATPANLCEAGGASQTLATWRTAISGDANSKNVRPRYVDTSVGNLNLDPSTNCQLDGAGLAVVGFDGEFDNAATSRQTAPDMGSDAFTFTQPAASFATTNPSCGISTASISLAGNGGPWSVTYTDGTTPVTVNNVATSPLSIGVTANKTYTITSATDAYGCSLGVTGATLVVAPGSTLSTASPNPASIGASVTISGTGLSGATAVSFNGTAAGFTVNSATQITATVPTGATSGPLTVTNLCGQVLTISSFTIIADLVISTTGQTIAPGTYNNITITGTGDATLGGAVVANGAVLVQNGGSLTTACQPLTGSGSFTLEAGATLSICDAAGITASGNTGAVQVTGARAFSTDAIYLYNGTVPQVTGSGLPATVRNLTLANGAGLGLSQALTVNQNLTLTNGVLTTGAFAVTLGNAGSMTESTSSYLTGTVQTTRTLSLAGTGSSFGGMGVSLTPDAASTALPGATLVVRTTGTAPTGASGGLAIRRYFAITPAVDTGLDVLLALNYFDHELNGIAENRLLLFKSAVGPNGPWGPVTGATYNATTNTVTRAHVGSFSTWTLGSLDNPLPVELTRFTATRRGPDALLQWTTASERNSAGFEVQVSADGRDFRRLGFVASPSPNSGTVRAYEFTDTEPGKAGRRYYRLRQLDRDGAAAFSQITVLSFGEPAVAAQMTAFPNPLASGQPLTVDATGLPGATLTLTDALQRIVWQTPLPTTETTTRLTLPPALTDHLPAGTYLLTVSGVVRPVRVVKE